MTRKEEEIFWSEYEEIKGSADNVRPNKDKCYWMWHSLDEVRKIHGFPTSEELEEKVKWNESDLVPNPS